MKISVEQIHMLKVTFKISTATFSEFAKILDASQMTVDDFFHSAFIGRMRELRAIKRDARPEFDEMEIDNDS